MSYPPSNSVSMKAEVIALGESLAGDYATHVSAEALPPGSPPEFGGSSMLSASVNLTGIDETNL